MTELDKKITDTSYLLFPYIVSSKQLFTNKSCKSAKITKIGLHTRIVARYNMLEKDIKYILFSIKKETSLYKTWIDGTTFVCEFLMDSKIDYIVPLILNCGVKFISSDTAMKNAMFWGDDLVVLTKNPGRSLSSQG